MAPYFVSRQCGRAFLGYMTAQRMRLMGERGQKNVNRPELVEKYGYDTKYAMHVLRLGFQGVDLLQTGKLTLPMKESERGFLLDVRQGKHTEQEVLTVAGALEKDLEDLLDTSPLLEEPNQEAVEEFMVNTYLQHWKSMESPLFGKRD